ncbi:MAG: glycosyltransferase family 2 protein [Acetatifactor sp.]|nr:glycosyltransferase family 2 protein [Acetatifactor sp.]
MKIDVIIPVYRPGLELFALLERLGNQTAAVQNIILMNTEKKYFQQLVNSNPKFWDEHRNIKVYHLSRREFDHGGTRHMGIMHSDAEIFLTMTQDAMPVDKYLVERLVQGLTDCVAVAYARQLPSGSSSELERISRAFNYPETSCVKTGDDVKTLGIKTFFCSNVCAAYRRDVYDELGGFIRHTIFNEDMIYAAKAVKAGYGIAYQAQAQVIHSHNYTNMQQLRRNFDLGVSQADHPEVFGNVSSESEGRKLVAEAWRRLKEKRQLYRFPGFLVQCCFKYAGYLLGKHYRRLPRKWVLALTGNRPYWR